MDPDTDWFTELKKQKHKPLFRQMESLTAPSNKIQQTQTRRHRQEEPQRANSTTQQRMETNQHLTYTNEAIRGNGHDTVVTNEMKHRNKLNTKHRDM